MIYFIQAAETPYVKIGRAKNIADRIQKLQTASPYNLEVLAVYRGKIADKLAEPWFHHYFRHYFVRGEWFADILPAEVFDAIDHLEAQSFPPYAKTFKSQLIHLIHPSL